MIIDSHAHLVAPLAFHAYRSDLLADRGRHRIPLRISDADVKESATKNVRIMDAVGTDVQLISPRPFQQMHAVRPERLVHWWIEDNNNLIARTVQLYPNRLAGVAGLPTCAGSPIENALPELQRAVNDLGFVGVSLNPDPYEGDGPSPPLGDRYWYPLYEKLVELDVPAMIHSAGCGNDRESYSAHFITEESIAIINLLNSDVFVDFPQLKLIVAHGGGSVPYQVGRWQAEVFHPVLGSRNGGTRFEVLLRKLWFDTVLHNPLSLELLFKVVGADRCLFGTENPGSGSGTNPDTGRQFDDLKPVIDSMAFLSDKERHQIFEENARTVYSRLNVMIGA